jgi:CheY-like chemotaxis protein
VRHRNQDSSEGLGRQASIVLTNAVPYERLIADDNLINQKVLIRMLKRLGIEHVDVVDNGKKAVDQEAKVPYDFILMDMQMPVMGGVEACRLIIDRKGGHPNPKVLFVTAHALNSYKSECVKAGGSGFLAKPFNVRQIEKSFQRLHILGDSAQEEFSKATSTL